MEHVLSNVVCGFAAAWHVFERSVLVGLPGVFRTFSVLAGAAQMCVAGGALLPPAVAVAGGARGGLAVAAHARRLVLCAANAFLSRLSSLSLRSLCLSSLSLASYRGKGCNFIN